MQSASNQRVLSYIIQWHILTGGGGGRHSLAFSSSELGDDVSYWLAIKKADKNKSHRERGGSFKGVGSDLGANFSDAGLKFCRWSYYDLGNRYFPVPRRELQMSLLFLNMCRVSWMNVDTRALPLDALDLFLFLSLPSWPRHFVVRFSWIPTDLIESLCAFFFSFWPFILIHFDRRTESIELKQDGAI